MKISKLTALLLLPLLLSLSGCFGTVVPKVAKKTQASYSDIADPSGNYQTSGEWGWTSNKSLIVDHTARDRYNSLIPTWGIYISPPVTNLDAGIRPYTNSTVKLWVKGKEAKPVPNPGNLFEMNPVAQDNLAIMTLLSQLPAPPWQSRPP